MQHRKPTCIPCLHDHLTALGYRQTIPCSLSGLHVFSIALLPASLSKLHDGHCLWWGLRHLLCRYQHDGGCQQLPDCCIAGRWKFSGL